MIKCRHGPGSACLALCVSQGCSEQQHTPPETTRLLTPRVPLNTMLTCPPSRRCSVPGRPPPAAALFPSCSWSQSSWLRTFPGPGRSSGTPAWRPLCEKWTEIQDRKWAAQSGYLMLLPLPPKKVDFISQPQTHFNIPRCSSCHTWILSSHCSLDNSCCSRTLQTDREDDNDQPDHHHTNCYQTRRSDIFDVWCNIMGHFHTNALCKAGHLRVGGVVISWRCSVFPYLH